MSDVKPALTREEWDRKESGPAGIEWTPEDPEALWVDGEGHISTRIENRHALAALALNSLPDGDPRKPTWDHVRALRDAGFKLSGLPDGDVCDEVADIIESLLPPEEL